MLSRAVDTRSAPAVSTYVVVVADDLIWSSRLRAAVERAGSSAIPAQTADGVTRVLEAAPAAAPVIVDLNGRTYDGVEVVRAAAASGRSVLAVGQHEDLELRKRALDAGARRVFSYNKLFSDGPAVVDSLLRGNL
jgi:DNA-binding response OmpR family regulator